MAYLRKRPKSPMWVACFFGMDGARVQRSTGTSVKKDAMRIALDWEAAAKDARSGRLTVDRCRGYLNNLLAATGQSLLDMVSTRKFAFDWLEIKGAERSGRTLERYKGTVEGFIQELGSSADLPVSGITPMHVESFKMAKLKSKLSPLSVNLHLKVLRAMFGSAHRKGLVERNVAAAVDFLDNVDQVRVDFSQSEIDAILIQARGTEWETATLFGFYCGMRLGDACRRTWAEIDLVGERVTWVPEKTSRKGKTMSLPLHPRLLEHLESIAGSDDARGYLTPGLAKSKPSGRSGLSKQFTAIMVQAGVVFEVHTADGKGRARASKSFHSLRHSMNSQLLSSGVDEAVRIQISGHSDARTNRRYSHVKAEGLRDAVNKLSGKGRRGLAREAE